MSIGFSSSPRDIREQGTQRNVRGKKTRNPGFEAGNHWVQCDRCAAAIRAEDALETWDNLIVCPDDWEIRHPQDFVRGRYDDIRAKGLVRSEAADVFAIAGTGIDNPGGPPDSGGATTEYSFTDVFIDNIQSEGGAEGPRVFATVPDTAIWKVTFTSSGMIIYQPNDGTANRVRTWYTDGPFTGIGDNVEIRIAFFGGLTAYNSDEFIPENIIGGTGSEPFVSLSTDQSYWVPKSSVGSSANGVVTAIRDVQNPALIKYPGNDGGGGAGNPGNPLEVTCVVNL